jgi:formylglycine-generating enzyme required for sulfatase activity/tRNA A-37 threonylcarbamoyl transferase component Bud32
MLGELEPGAIFGRDFKVVRPLRAGGMGAVYIVEQLSTGKQRALKVMARELARDAATRERFVLEARVGAHIDSDHVVEVVTAGVDEQTQAPFLVMELLKGEELADVIERVGPLPLGDVAEVLSQLGHALERAHEKGIVHRDLKPENIFLAVSRRRDSTFTVKILDFGVAKIVADQQQRGTQPLGTPLFMSPEQTEHLGRIAPASDVWALGLIVFRLLTGRDFWKCAETGTLPVLLREIVVDPIPAASQRAAELGVGARLPPGFDAWFARTVSRDMDARFAEAGEATRAFATLVPPDAPRGLLASSVLAPAGTARDMGSAATITASEAYGTLQPNQAGSTVASTAGLATAGSTAAGTAAATGAIPASRSKVPVIAGAVAALGLAAGAVAFFSKGAAGPEPGPSAQSAPSAAPAPPSSAPPAEPACPPGMQLIQAGNMFMGTRSGEGNASPAHRVTVSAFCLDKTEVTTEAYEACASAGNCLRPLQDVDFPGMKPAQREKFKKLCNAGRPEQRQHPINCVDWNMADNFCRVTGGRLAEGGARLPTEAEWEFAARGSVQRTYPWGDEEPDATRLNACGLECREWMTEHRETTDVMYEGDDGFPATAPVGSFVAGASQAGLLDLAGNVWEWTADWFGPYTEGALDNPRGPDPGTERVVRGGAFNGFMADWAKPSYRWKTLPTTYNHAIGFRCATAAR